MHSIARRYDYVATERKQSYVVKHCLEATNPLVQVYDKMGHEVVAPTTVTNRNTVVVYPYTHVIKNGELHVEEVEIGMIVVTV